MKKISTTQKIILIIILLFLSLIIRLYLAQYIGNKFDHNCWQTWSYTSQKYGFTNIYEKHLDNKTSISNYLPPYIYVLCGIGKIYKNIFSPDFLYNTKIIIFLLKLPAIFFDLLIGLILFYIVNKKNKFDSAYLISALWLLNPAIIYESAYWGQIDSIPALFILLSIYFIAKEKLSLSWILITIASLFKLQSIIFIPLIFFVNIYKTNVRLTIKNIILALLTGVIICFPFLINGKLINILQVIFSSPGYYPILSANAFNPWWLFYNNQNMYQLGDTQKLFGIISYVIIGLTLFFISYLTNIINYFKKNNKNLIYLSAAIIAFSFFMLPTEMHERYLFPIFPLLLMCLAIFKVKKILLIYLVLSFSFLANLIAVTPFSDLTQKIFNLTPLSSWPIVFLNIILFIAIFIYYLKYPTYEHDQTT